MSRIPQPAGARGSLKWIQRAVNENWPSLNQPIKEQLGKGEQIEWSSPLQNDDFAEYRDGTFLELLKSLELIQARLDTTAKALNARHDRVAWHTSFYQVANRLAHLHWLRNLGIDARLVMVNFLNDADMGGPSSAREWHAAYQVAYHVMGLGRRHKLTPYIIEVFPDLENQRI